MKNPKARRVIRYVPVVLWIGLIFYFSSQPYKEQSIQPFLQRNVSVEKAREVLPNVTVHYRHNSIAAQKAPYQFIEFFFRKSSHMFVYGMLALLGFAALLSYKERLPIKLYIVLCLVASIAMLDEWNQGRSPGRTSAYQDVGVDLAGGTIALGFAVVWYLIRKQNEIRSAGERRDSR